VARAEKTKPSGHAEGVFFSVDIYDSFVVKKLKPQKTAKLVRIQKNQMDRKVKDHEVSSEDTEAALKFIADTQTYLSERMECVLPCYLVDGKLFMPKAPGQRADVVGKDWPYIQELKHHYAAEIERLGYKLTDLGMQNIYYDPRDGMIYLIDFHSIRDRKKDLEEGD